MRTSHPPTHIHTHTHTCHLLISAYLDKRGRNRSWRTEILALVTVEIRYRQTQLVGTCVHAPLGLPRWAAFRLTYCSNFGSRGGQGGISDGKQDEKNGSKVCIRPYTCTVYIYHSTKAPCSIAYNKYAIIKWRRFILWFLSACSLAQLKISSHQQFSGLWNLRGHWLLLQCFHSSSLTKTVGVNWRGHLPMLQRVANYRQDA